MSDVFNNQVLWKSYDYFLEAGQPNTYWLYLVYLVCSMGIVISLNNLNSLIKMISVYLSLYLFSTVRYLLSMFSEMGDEISLEDFRALFITAWYFSMWVWILLKLKKEKLHRILL